MQSLNLPKPTLHLPLNEDLRYYSRVTLSQKRKSVKRKFSYDMFGLPIADGYFDGSDDALIELLWNQPISNGTDFTLSFHARPELIKESVLLFLEYNSKRSLAIGMSSQGNLSIT